MSGLLLEDLSRQDRHKLLCAVAVSRPIASETTLDVSGAVNAALFRFFNVFSEDLPLIGRSAAGKQAAPKATERQLT